MQLNKLVSVHTYEHLRLVSDTLYGDSSDLIYKAYNTILKRTGPINIKYIEKEFARATGRDIEELFEMQPGDLV